MSDVASGVTRLGIIGGTFDPVHLGHLIIAEEFWYRLGLERVLFLPTSSPPHKVGRAISPVADRLAMLRLAIEGNPHFAVSLVDVERSGPTYTADTLAILAGQHPGAQLFFLIGLDSLRDLPTWHEPGRIVRQARLAVAGRPGVTLDLPAVLAQVPEAADRIDFVDVPQIDISASAIRRRVRNGAPITYQVPPAVEAYISARGLYRTLGQV
ncbi:MAG TPA: nicotinate-nucleotide adenylyltransferase [Thermomicrobiaceae bacterium]|nr:nicotinate-nucleotide adenylyltransferase [Thermomicrobiaceae bacterium]